MFRVRKIFPKTFVTAQKLQITPVKIQEKSLTLQERMAEIDSLINEVKTARDKMMEHYSLSKMI